MGYYTQHKLDIIDISIQGKETVEQVFNVIKADERFKYIFDTLGEFSNEAKGYTLQDDMKEFSRLFPEKLFVIEGQGEDTHDHWIAEIQNGEVYHFSVPQLPLIRRNMSKQDLADCINMSVCYLKGLKKTKAYDSLTEDEQVHFNYAVRSLDTLLN